MKTSSRICLILLRNEAIVLFQMRQLALRSVISHQRVFVISVFITCNETLLLGLAVGVMGGGDVGDFMRFISPPTHTSDAIVASARGADLRAPFRSWQDSRSADILNFFICAESIRRVIMKYRINTRGNHSLIIFQGSCLEKSHLMNCHEILNRH